MKLENIISVVKWVIVIVAILVVYGMPFARLSDKNEVSITNFLKDSFWTLQGHNKFLMTFVPIGIFFWFIDYVRSKLKHTIAWHLGSIIKISLYVVMIFWVFSWFIGPLTYVEAEKDLTTYFETIIASESGIYRLIALIIMASIVIIIIRLQAKEVPKTPREEY